jgi:hypothetical protein
MFTFSQILLAALRCAAALSLGFLVQSASASTTLVWEPGSPGITVGSSFTMQLRGLELSDVYAYQFSLDFDQGIVQLTGVSEGTALSSVNTTSFAAGSIDRWTGHLGLTGTTLIGDTSGFSGNGVLASVSFSTMAAGSVRS